MEKNQVDIILDPCQANDDISERAVHDVTENGQSENSNISKEKIIHSTAEKSTEILSTVEVLEKSSIEDVKDGTGDITTAIRIEASKSDEVQISMLAECPIIDDSCGSKEPKSLQTDSITTRSVDERNEDVVEVVEILNQNSKIEITERNHYEKISTSKNMESPSPSNKMRVSKDHSLRLISGRRGLRELSFHSRSKHFNSPCKADESLKFQFSNSNHHNSKMFGKNFSLLNQSMKRRLNNIDDEIDPDISVFKRICLTAFKMLNKFRAPISFMFPRSTNAIPNSQSNRNEGVENVSIVDSEEMRDNPVVLEAVFDVKKV